MGKTRFLKWIHLINTGWFGLCVGYVLLLALRQAGVQWWVIFSLSGFSAVLFFLGVSLYLVAIYRSAARSQIIQEEHPLTSTDYYMVFYYMIPLMGGLAGIAGAAGLEDLTQGLLGIAYGTIGATFAVWIVVDPALGFLESVLPTSRRMRQVRLELARRQKEQEERQKQLLLDQITREEQEFQHRCQIRLEPLCRQLTALIGEGPEAVPAHEGKVVDIGVEAWQIGGLAAMQQLQKMAQDYCRQSWPQQALEMGWIDVWWDGIGDWRCQPLGEKGRLAGTPKS
ncbi:MAG: hypothetical protein BWY71_00772 [Planctomycetes bacterium ADurb.Bin412]|nr:MAG: hypothetical protein BWY71_00772 [Planctomycetes bacterium ADurb.Bin412]